MSDSWDDIAGWWVDAVRADPAQSDDTHAALAGLLDGTAGPTIDLGCGEGQGMRLLTGPVVGVDLSHDLLRIARTVGPVVRARLPDLAWARSASVGRAVSVGLLDLVSDHVHFLAETCRVVRRGGHLLVVMNHPVATAPDSAALADPEGEVLWRWGTYLTPGSLPQHIGTRTVELFHRPLGTLLSDAAEAGWLLEQMVELGPGRSTIARYPDLHGQEEIPAMLGLRWRSG